LFTDWDKGVHKIVKSMDSLAKKPQTPIPDLTDTLLDRRVQSLLRGLVHDLSNINAATQGYLVLLRMRGITDSRAAEYIEGLKRATEKTSELLKTIKQGLV
jgi:hypothetical protein